MSLATHLAPYVRAAFSGLYIETFEPEEALREIHGLCAVEEWTVAAWDIDRGLVVSGDSGPAAAADPLAALRSLPALATPNGTTPLVLKNFHRFLGSAEIVQTLQHQLEAGKATRMFVVILAPTIALPIELQRSFVVLAHALPDREQLEQIAGELVGEESFRTNPSRLPLLDAAVGLTRTEAEGAFTLSLAHHDELRADVLWEWKAQSLRKQNLLTLHRGGSTVADLGGLTALKTFCRRALPPGRSVKARGALLLSPPGCGKSAFCKSLGAEVGRPVLSLDLGALYGSLNGETERNIRQALAIADAMAPAILFVDELEKSLSGIGGQGDSGVSTRLFGTLLTWLADHESDVFFLGTANDISRLPPEFTRAERLDGVFFVDLPSAEQRREIWSLYRRQYDIAAPQPLPKDDGWSGAEIKSCCRLSALLDVPLSEAARNVVPVSVTSAEAIDRLRTWASGRCLSADHAGLYQRPTVKAASRRKVAEIIDGPTLGPFSRRSEALAAEVAWLTEHRLGSAVV